MSISLSQGNAILRMMNQQRPFVLALLAYAVQRGVDAPMLCEVCGIDLKELTTHDAGIPEAKLNRLWTKASEASNDPHFGLHFGEALQLAALGAVGEIIKNSESVGQALSIAASLTPAVTPLAKINVDRKEDQFTVHFVPEKDVRDQRALPHILDFLFVFTLHELSGFLLKRIQPSGITFQRPIDSHEYERVLLCKPAMASDYSMSFRSEYWDEPILTANYEVQQLFLKRLKSNEKKNFEQVPFQVRVMDYLMENSYTGLHSLEDVASNFNMTARSLQRRLQDESVTFQQITESVRKSLALHYLESGKYQIKEISAMLGYNEISAFSRAFKRWTGKAPVEFRA